jgi:hypothetical protein
MSAPFLNHLPEGCRHMTLYTLADYSEKNVKENIVKRFLFLEKHLNYHLIFRCFLKKFIFLLEVIKYE